MRRRSRIEGLEARVEQLLLRTGQLEARVGELETENGRLRAGNRRLKREGRKLTDEVRYLRREVRRTGGEVKPPPAAKPKDDHDSDEPADVPGQTGERRKRGGQPGHEPRNRAPLPENKVDRFEDVKPKKCSGCGKALAGDGRLFHQHQVTELPEPKAETVEWRLYAVPCACGEVTSARLPDGVPRGNFGPRLQAFVGLLTGGYRLSKRGVQELLRDTFGVTIALGSVTECEQAVSEALAKPHAEALVHAQEQPVKHADETGWPEGQKKAYLWTIVTAAVTVFVIAHGRTKELARSLVGAAGVLVSDRLASYHYWPDRRRQFCWAHLKRRFEEFLLGDEASLALGAKLLAQVRLLFEFWHRARDETMSRHAFKKEMVPVMRTVRSLLQEGTACTDPEVAGTCRELLDHDLALWTFVRVAGVEPTNNAAEQALRHGVIWRKGCFGTQSARGSRFAERILTARATLRVQERNVTAFVVAACQARLTGAAPPSLLPAELRHADAA